MAISPLTAISPMPSSQMASPMMGPTKAGSGFAQVLDNVLQENREANQAANAAVQSLVTGEAQDLHTVSMAVARADLSFRLILEMRNRLTEAYQEVTRMQV